jgi:cholesterol 7-desaturase
METLNKIYQNAYNLIENEDTRNYIVLPSIFILLTFLYYRTFGFYVYVEKLQTDKARAHRRRGNPPPSYPNGWFRIESTRNLKAGDVKYIKLCGRHIALFRGEDRIAYAVNAFCTHMGANLGIGG